MQALKAVLPLQWLYSDKLETGAAVFWPLFFRMEMQVCGFRIQRRLHFPGKGCRLTWSHTHVLITVPWQSRPAFSYSLQRPGGRGTTRWALGRYDRRAGER